MKTLIQDIRHGMRSLTRQPVFLLVAIFTLALGIGANTAVFSTVYAVLLRPLPYPEPDRLMSVRGRTPDFAHASLCMPDFDDWKAGQTTFTSLSMVRRNNFSISAPEGDPQPERVTCSEVSSDFLTTLGLPPTLGRAFTPEEDTPGGPRAVMLSDDLWQRRFGADPKVIGHRLIVDGVSREIVAVLPPEVRFPRGSQMWIPFGELRASEGAQNRDNHAGYGGLGRLKPGVSAAQAQADLDRVAADLERRYPDSNTGWRSSVQTLLESSVGDYRGNLILLVGAVVGVLVIACGNVANLQLARASARQKELAVRAALGATRGRLARQLLTEGALLGLMGGAAGLLLAMWALDAILALSPANVPRFQETRIDPLALAFTAAVALGAGLLVGVWPAWRLSGVSGMAGALHESNVRGGSSSAARRRMRGLLVIAQVALAIVLLAAAGLMRASYRHVAEAPLGFDPHGILLLDLSLPKSSYPTLERQNEFFDRLLARLGAVPGIAAVATGVNNPFDESESDTSVHIVGTPEQAPALTPSTEYNTISPDYFRVLKQPLLRGRAFNAEDGPGKPLVAIIDEQFARQFFAGVDPIGKQLDNPFGTSKTPAPMTIVGVVGHSRNNAAGSDEPNERMVQLYVPGTQQSQWQSTLMLRLEDSNADPLALIEAVKAEIRAIDPMQAVSNVTTMDRAIAGSLATRRLVMTMLGVFGVLALVLASVGLYGVMALNVVQRTRELGIRLALGAQRGGLMGLVLRQGMTLVAVGLGIGLVATLAIGRLLTKMLYGVGQGDPAVLVGSSLVLTLVALAACWLPARRAMRIDPMVALRNE